ncbi:hypothetical protein COCON_G00093830 [Conger conger]|uniref:Met-enkephalin n=1 Tax=Conger conger TaxID=82655 RepID=A0A9Q1DLT3_CONCO|nr:proopiomelanocortin a [Conger conger]KAJ8274758.1 hypothetical protein COCON_G00093830 [Conger conger]
MLCPAWKLALAVLCAFCSETSGQCWEHLHCRDLSSEENMLECIRQCTSELTAGRHAPSAVEADGDEGTLGLLLPVLSGMQEGPEVEEQGREPRQEEKRSYSMEHFRWGKPVGRKRRPIKVFPSAMEEESSEAYPAEMRRELQGNWDYAPEEEGSLSEDHPQLTLQAKKDSPYKMKHFRWNGPPASKRYGGFMKPWGERSQKPLLTLFKNVIIKDGQQKKAQ